MITAEIILRHQAARRELMNAADGRGVKVKPLGAGRFRLEGATRRVLETVAEASHHYGEHFTITADGEIHETTIIRETA